MHHAVSALILGSKWCTQTFLYTYEFDSFHANIFLRIRRARFFRLQINFILVSALHLLVTINITLTISETPPTWRLHFCFWHVIFQVFKFGVVQNQSAVRQSPGRLGK